MAMMSAMAPKRSRSVSPELEHDGIHHNGSALGSSPEGATSTPSGGGGIGSGPQAATKSRRSHAKTRTGCKTCKRRKIKCDETRPSCRNCVRHSVPCDFLDSTAPATHPSADQSLNLVDLELLHNFVTATYTTLADDPFLRNLWKLTIVRMGVECSYVMRSILAVSALHMARYKPQRKEELTERAAVYHRLASRVAMPLMEECRREDQENLWVFSVLSLYYTLGSGPPEDIFMLSGEPPSPNWIHLLRGVRHLLSELQPQNYNGRLTPLLSQGTSRWHAAHTHQHTNSPLLRELQARIAATVTDQALLSIFNMAIEELRMQLSLVMSEEEQHHRVDLMDALVWQIMVADTFLPLLREPSVLQEAAAIMAHFGVILKRFEGHWWLQGWGAVLTEKVWEVLDGEHRPWIQWAVEEVGWVPP